MSGMSGMSGGVTPEELEQMLRDSKQAEMEQQQPTAPPCSVVMKDGNVFMIDEPECWVWHPKGIFGTGYWQGDDTKTEQDCLLMEINYVVYDFSGFGPVPPISRDPEAGIRDDDEGEAVA